jgi:hypothetical protein
MIGFYKQIKNQEGKLEIQLSNIMSIKVKLQSTLDFI